MWNESLGSGNSQGRLLAPYSADGMDSVSSRRVSAASDDSFDASSYVHVDSKLNNKMPKCLFNCGIREKALENHFTKTSTHPAGSSVTKSGKRVIRKRLSVSEFKASRMKANINNNSNAASRKMRKNEGDVLNSSSSDNDTLPKTKKRSTDVLSAKIQHLLFEMKRLRQMDRDILRQFLIINDTIEEQKWMMEEKQEDIKRSLSEEGEDSVNFDAVQAAAVERGDDEESASASSHNSSTKVFNESSPSKNVQIAKNDPKIVGKDSDLVSTSSDSALSMTGGSSTLSSTTSLPVSNRSTSPSTSNLSTTSASSSYIDSMDAKAKANEIISTARTEPIRRIEHEVEGDDVEGYFRMNGNAMKRGSYPFPRQSQSFDMSYSARGHTYDDNTLDSAYSTRRGSTDSDSRDAAEYGMAVRRVNRSYETPYRTDGYQARPMPRSNSVREPNDMRNRVTRISVRPDGTVDDQSKRNGIRRVRSVNERTSVPDRQLQNSMAQRQLAKFNISRQVANLSFVPIAEQEPDVMSENGRFYSPEQSCRSENKARHVNHRHINPPRGPQPTTRNRLPAQFTDSSRGSPLSPPRSSSSHSSAFSQSNYIINEADQYRSHGSNCKEPVWVPQFPGSVKANNHYGGAHHYHQSLLAQSYSFHRNHLDGNYADPCYEKPRGKYSQRVSTNCAPEYHENFENKRVLAMSRSSSNGKGSTQAVYQWIQTQDDITYL